MMFRIYCILLVSFFCSWAYSGSNKPVDNGLMAGKLTVEMEGRGFYLTAPSATFDGGKTLTINSPVLHLLGDMKEEQDKALSCLDLENLAEFAEAFDKGIRNSNILSSMELKYRSGDGSNCIKDNKLDQAIAHVSSQSGNLIITFKDDLPLSVGQQLMEQVTMLFKTWVSPTDDWYMTWSKTPGGPFPRHAVCCDCGGWCAFLWIVFAYCDQCFQPFGSENCCKNCRLPPAPGGTCP